MEVYRLVSKDHANLDGLGGLFVAGRWNIKGLRIVYTASSRSLAILENLVHISDPLVLPKNMVILSVHIPDSIKYRSVQEPELTKKWKNKLLETRYLGSEFLKKGKNALLAVPSVLVPEEYNYIINPIHPDSKKCTIIKSEPFNFDQRLLK